MAITIHREMTERTVTLELLKVGDFFRVAAQPGRTYVRLELSDCRSVEVLVYYNEDPEREATRVCFDGATKVTKLDVTMTVKDA